MPRTAVFRAHAAAAAKIEQRTETAERYRRLADEYRARAKIMFQEDMSETALLGIAAAAEEAAIIAEQKDLDATVAGLAPECGDCGTELTDDSEIEAELCRHCQRELFESENEGV